MAIFFPGGQLASWGPPGLPNRKVALPPSVTRHVYGVNLTIHCFAAAFWAEPLSVRDHCELGRETEHVPAPVALDVVAEKHLVSAPAARALLALTCLDLCFLQSALPPTRAR